MGAAVWAVVALSVSAPVTAARLLPAYGAAGYDFVYLSHTRVALGTLSDEGRLSLRVANRGGAAAASTAGDLYVFSGRTGYRVAADGRLQPWVTLDGEVREAAAVAEGVVLLVAGATVRGELRAARVLLWNTNTGSATAAPQVRPRWNPLFLRSAPGRPELLVGVRKPAHFDPVVRTRPFLYRCTPGAVEPVWQGTSFSHPFVDAALVRLPELPGIALGALEVLAGGLRVVRAYAWTGAAMEAVAAGAPAALGDSLQPAGPSELAVFEARGPQRRLLVLGWGNKKTAQNVTLLQTVARSPWLPQRPSAWTVVARGARRWLIYGTRGGEVRAAPLAAGTSDLPRR